MSETTVVAPRRGRPRKVTEVTEPELPVETAADVREPAAEVEITPVPKRGPLTPAQFDDDGWKNLPVQLRNRPGL